MSAFEPPTLNIADRIGEQVIVSRFDGEAGRGWALTMETSGRISLVVGQGQGAPERVTSKVSLREWDWALVAASYDAASG